MCCLCAAVSRTLVAVTACESLSIREVQAPQDRTAATSATPGARADVSGYFRERRRCAELFSMIVRGQTLPVPPAAAERMKQCRGVGIAAGLGLYQVDPGLLVSLLRAQQRQVACVPVLPLPLGEIERGFRGRFRGGRCLQRLGILCECGEGVSYVLKGGQNGAAVLLGRLPVGRSGGALLMQQRPALEDGRGQVRTHRPEAGA